MEKDVGMMHALACRHGSYLGQDTVVILIPICAYCIPIPITLDLPTSLQGLIF